MSRVDPHAVPVPLTPDSGQPLRYRFIDIMRGIAMVLMIATHATDAFLADSWKHNEVWYNLNILFGFVAPAYLFFSGTTLWVALSRRGDELFALGPRTQQLLRRTGVIVLLGYWLQIPVLSLRQLIIIHRPHELAQLFNSNILQVIGLTLIAVTLVAWKSGSLNQTRLIALLAAALIVAITPPLLHSTIYQTLPLPVRFYVAPQPPAVFALFPHAAYLLAGFVMAPALVHTSDSRLGWLRILATGVALLTAAGILNVLFATAPPYDGFWDTTPQQFLFRTGGLAIATGIILLLARHISQRSTDWLEFAGRKSLAIYVLHLMIVYGSAMNMGIRYWLHGALNNSLSPLTTATATVGIIGVTWFAVWFWEWLRVSYPTVALWSKRIWWGTFWGFFLLKP